MIDFAQETGCLVRYNSSSEGLVIDEKTIKLITQMSVFCDMNVLFAPETIETCAGYVSSTLKKI